MFTRQQRIVHRVLVGAVLAPMWSGPVKGVKGWARWRAWGWLAVVLAAGGRESWGGEDPDEVAERTRMHPFGPRGGVA